MCEGRVSGQTASHVRYFRPTPVCSEDEARSERCRGWGYPTVNLMRKSLQQVLAEYGRVALVVYFAIFLAVLVGSWTAIRLGWRPENAPGDVGALTAAYLVTKLTQPLRIAVTLAFTPLVAKVQERLARRAG